MLKYHKNQVITYRSQGETVWLRASLSCVVSSVEVSASRSRSAESLMYDGWRRLPAEQRRRVRGSGRTPTTDKITFDEQWITTHVQLQFLQTQLLERFKSEMTYFVPSAMSNSTHTLKLSYYKTTVWVNSHYV